MPLLPSLLTILIAATGGWLLATLFIRFLFKPYLPKKFLGISYIGVIPCMKPVLSGWIAAAIREKLLSVEAIEKKIDDPALMAQLRPEIENHIDLFLKEKLKVAFPLLAGLMGDKTTGALKGAFLAEVELIFPSVLKNFSGKMIRQWQPAQVIENKMAAINLAEVEKLVRFNASRQIMLFRLVAALAGALLGFLQLLLIIYFR